MTRSRLILSFYNKFKQSMFIRSKRYATKTIAMIAASSLAFIPFTQTVNAQAQSVPAIRDAEIEQLVKDYTIPIFQAAGLKTKKIEIVIVNDNSFNAFVDGQRLFINTGALMQAETPNEIIGVIAHETGHLANGHQQRLREQIKRVQTLAVIGMLVGISASVAGASTHNQSAASAGGGIALGSNELAMRSLLSYQRGEEAAADRAAINYLNKTQQSAKGMLITFQRFSSSLAMSGSHIDPYRISHPLPQERIAAIEELAKNSPYYDKKDSPELQRRHDMMRAKIAASTDHFAELRRMFKNDPRGLPAQYGEAILSVNSGSPKIAVTKVNALIKEQPKNPFFQELLGDALIKANNPEGAASAYKLAAELDSGHSSLMRINYGHALLLTGKPKNVSLAITEIKNGITNEPDFAEGYGYLAMAYGQNGQVALADLATADKNYFNGDRMQARIFATRAQQKLKRGSTDWLRAQDILNTTQLNKK